MDRILVAYGTKFASTAEIAEVIAETLRGSGLDVDVRRAGEVGDLDQYRAVILGSAVYMARWRRDATRLLRRHRRELAQRDVWLFSSGPVGQPPEETDARAQRWLRPKRIEQLAATIGARDHAIFGGRVGEDAGGVLRRNMAKSTPPELRDRRDWDEIAAWARTIAAALSRSPHRPGAPDPS